MFLRLILVFIVSIFATPSIAHGEDERATYITTDKLAKNDTQASEETWVIERLSNGILQTRKIPHSLYGSITVEQVASTSNWGIRLTRYGNSPFYFKQFLSISPEYMNPGDTSYGYVEVLKFGAENDEFSESWPLFAEVVAIDTFRLLRQIKLTMYQANGVKIEIRREYEPGKYFTPITEQTMRYEPKNSDEAIPELILKTYFIVERQ